VDPFLYLDRDTWVHRLDPRTKMLLLVGTFVLAFVFVNPLYGLVVLGVVLLFGGLARVLVNLKRIWFILFMIGVMSVIMWSIFAQGRTTLFLFIEWEAILYGIGIAIRIIVTVIAGMIFLSTTRNEEIATGLVKLGVPYRFAFAISTALRLVPTVAATGSTIGQAQRSRGLDLDSGSILERVRKNVPLLIPVFVSTIRSTNIFSMALESKGFGASPKRTYFLHLAMKRRDWLVLLLFVLLLAAAIAVRLLGYGGLEGVTR
jgi:energy-coupling factor transport system permease protein